MHCCKVVCLGATAAAAANKINESKSMIMALLNLSTLPISSLSHHHLHRTSHTLLGLPSLPPSTPTPSSSLRPCISTLNHLQLPSHSHHVDPGFDSELEEEEEEEEEEGFETINQEEKEEEGIPIRQMGSSLLTETSDNRPRLPNLSVKEKKELASYAHSLGKKLKSQQVGKSGVTPSLVASFVGTLEANELLKLKVHSSCPGELADVVRQLQEETGSVAVGLIGRTVILYRPSLSKMKDGEKKKQAPQRVRKSFISKPVEEPVWRIPLPNGSQTLACQKRLFFGGSGIEIDILSLGDVTVKLSHIFQLDFWARRAEVQRWIEESMLHVLRPSDEEMVRMRYLKKPKIKSKKYSKYDAFKVWLGGDESKLLRILKIVAQKYNYVLFRAFVYRKIMCLFTASSRAVGMLGLVDVVRLVTSKDLLEIVEDVLEIF